MSSRKTVPGERTDSMRNSVEMGYGKSISDLDLLLMHKSIQELTPPPDSYGTIQPCFHIKSVLDSKAKETVFITYRQAVTISQVLSKDKVYTSKKDGTLIPLHKLSSKKSAALRCTDCSSHNFQNNFICLQCPHVGCFGDHKHAYNHYKLNQHLFCIDSQNGLLYCFLCGNYVNHEQLEKIRLEVMQDETFHPDSADNEDLDLYYSKPTISAISGLKGFVNLGATCFMSSILQTMVHNPILKYHFFNNDFHYFNCEKNQDALKNEGVIEESNACVSCSIDTIFQSFYTSNSNEGFGMTNLLATAWYKKKSLAGFQEQDAHEFWQFLLNEFHLDYERIVNKLNGTNGQQVSRSSTPIESHRNCQCITHTTFAGELQSSIKCALCNSITKTIDPMMDISLEINHLKDTVGKSEITLYDCLDLYTLEEKLDVMYTCKYCGEKSKAVKSLLLSTIPPVLSIQLKRFKHSLMSDTASKIETPVKTPLFLNLTKYAHDHDPSDGETDGNKVYELFAVVCHAGSVNTGHYIVLVKDGYGQWFKFDDSVISLISQEEVTNTNAYLLFYITHKI